ncbi:MAG: outer membrane beta-barrel protein [Fibrobacter sp.]|nr:outer membrane beta-barrel protein [Fibrobacter sp.]
MKKLFMLTALAASFSFATSEPHVHDGGFLSIAMGMGYQSMDYTTYNYDEDTYGHSGFATDIDVKLGCSVTDMVAVHITLTGDTPTESVGEGRDDNEVKANLSLLGIGTTLYFPGNYLASASLGIGQFRVYDDISTFHARVVSNPDKYSRSGFAFQIAAGKEWWVSDNWGIGATAALLYGFETNLADARESSLSISLRFSATYN